MLFETPLDASLYAKGHGIGKWDIGDPRYISRRRAFFGKYDHGGSCTAPQKKSGFHERLLESVGIDGQSGGLCIAAADF